MKAGKAVFEDWFTTFGRRNRRSYFLSSGLLLLILVATGIARSFVVEVNLRTSIQFGQPIDSLAVLFTALEWMIIIFFLIMTAQRCHDFGWSGKFVNVVILCALLARVPVSTNQSSYDEWVRDTEFVGLLMDSVIVAVWAIVCVIPGSRKENKFGPNPLL